MRKYFGRACLSAALLGWSGLSYGAELNGNETSVADQYNLADIVDGNVTEVGYDCGCQADCGVCQSCCEPCVGDWLDNTVFFTGADVYKSIGDRLTNINGGTGSLTASFGGVTGFNTGFGIGESDIRGQFGASYGLYDPRGRLEIVPNGDDVEQQAFVTTGIYKRGDMTYSDDRWSYGTVVDAFISDNWGINANEVELGQLRGILGYALSERFEVGVFGTANLWDDSAAVTVAGAPGVRRQVRAANQANAYLRGNTTAGGSLMGYAGIFDNADIQDWQFGATGEAPLSQYFSLYGNFNYAVPSARAGSPGSGEEQFNVGFGIAYYFGGKAASPSVTGQKGIPLLDVANNSSFLITD